MASINGLQTKATVLLNRVSGFVFADRPVRFITGPTPFGAPDPNAHRPGSEPGPGRGARTLGNSRPALGERG